MDPLSDVLSLVRPHHYGSGALRGGGRWAFTFEAHDAVKCYAVVKGKCLFVVDAVKNPVHLETGDCLMRAVRGPTVGTGAGAAKESLGKLRAA